MKNMKKITLLALAFLLCITISAQQKAPKWIKKANQAVLQVETFDKTGKKLHTGNAFFISEDGEVLSDYSLFKDATHATLTTIDGTQYPVSEVLGADEFYDVIRLKANLPKKTPYLKMASTSLAIGSKVILLPYNNEKQPSFVVGSIKEVTPLKSVFNYYQMELPLLTSQLSVPVLTEDGEVVGLAQADAGGSTTHSYALSAPYAQSLQMLPSDIFNKTYTAIGIKKAWPQAIEDALLMLYVVSASQDPTTKLETLNDLIATFPQASEGYANRASHYAYNRMNLASTESEQQALLQKAKEDMAISLQKATKKAEVLFNQATLIYNLAVTDSTLKSEDWSVDKAMSLLHQAIAMDDIPQYRQLEADICLYKQDYTKALELYQLVNASDFASHASYYWTAKTKQQIPDTNIGEVIALLDSAILRCGQAYQKEASMYVLERVELKNELGLFKEVAEDYNLYYALVGGNVSDTFYYFREQAYFKLGDLSAALADIDAAIKLSPDDANYYAERAAIYVRMSNYDAALLSIDTALKLDPSFAACYRLRGVCYIRLKQSENACKALEKAVELGDTVAMNLQKKNCK